MRLRQPVPRAAAFAAAFAAAVVALALAACGGGRIVPLAGPAPCAGDTTAYSSADTARGVTPARPAAVALPAGVPSRKGLRDIRFVVDPTGRVERATIRITIDGAPAEDRYVRRSVEAYEFEPASRGGCAVRFEFGMTVRI
ncbi:MAG TPA: hypothetical protein VD838_00270 [Anaeromyxobacteraceae bacterium]|nr:hypothetical protein [Anaeromyxobacteraceae bacterium]